MSTTPPHESLTGEARVRGHSVGSNFTAAFQPPSQPPLPSANARRNSSFTPSSTPSSSNQMSLRGMRRLEARRTMEQTHFLATKARARNLNPPVDMRMLDYVAPYDGNLMCPICRCPFVDPVILTECDHCFCRDCIRQTWRVPYNPLGPRGDCPSCRTPAKLGPRSATSKILVNILDDLVVKCPKSEEGCTAEIKRGEVQDHVNIYCGYAVVECSAEDCELPLRRKDVDKGCLHHGVSCIDCRDEMQTSTLETHWRNECPNRKMKCELCDQDLFYRELDEHTQTSCPAISIPCPGAAFGCTTRGRREEAEEHAKSCTFAKLAPILSAQKQRLDEQEIAQKAMTRKLDVLQNGFTAMHSILNPSEDYADFHDTDENRSPRQRSNTTSDITSDLSGLQTSYFSPSNATNSETTPPSRTTPFPPAQSRPVPFPPASRPIDLPEPFTSDFDLSFPAHSATNTGLPNEPYASPLHHLLSMHESLRDEMSRTSAAMAEIDGRLSMQNLNENMRTREEVTYLGAQLAGMARQVHWLTSERLQRQQGHGGTAGGANGGASASGSVASAAASAGAGVEAAVEAASNVLRGSHRLSNGGNGMRRGLSEEGRTKL